MSDERWEYQVLPAPTSLWGTTKPEEMTEALNKVGLQGWELVDVCRMGTQFTFFLKRRR